MSAPMFTRRLRLSRIAILTGLLAALAVMAPWAAATGSGYNLSYTRGAGSTSVGAVDLTSVSSTDTGASNLTISFTVSGTLNLHSSSYFYFVWFGGSAQSNATGFVSFSNSTAGSYDFYSGGSSSGSLTYTNSGSTLTFGVPKTSAGPSSSFAVNVDAYEASGGGVAGSWLGTNYMGGGGGTTCTTVSCVTTTTNTAIATAVLFGVIALVVIVVVIVLVVVLVMRKKKAAPPPMMPGTMAPPPPPPPAQP